jgi:hypothetical protein
MVSLTIPFSPWTKGKHDSELEEAIAEKQAARHCRQYRNADRGISSCAFRRVDRAALAASMGIFGENAAAARAARWGFSHRTDAVVAAAHIAHRKFVYKDEMS